MIFFYLIQDAISDKRKVGVSRKLYSHICIIALIAAFFGVVVQLAIGGVIAGLIAGAAAFLGFISGYRWHHSRTERRARRTDHDS